MTYWVYENWVAEDKAVIHTATCGHCKNGQGCHPNPQGDRNGQWLGPFNTISQAESAATATGKPTRRHTCCKGTTSSIFPSLLACLLIAACSPSQEPTMLERYPGPWVQEFNLPITKALAANDIRICGSYKYRASSRDTGEYLVYCSMDEKNWTAFIVWAPIEKILGPYVPDPTIPAN